MSHQCHWLAQSVPRVLKGCRFGCHYRAKVAAAIQCSADNTLAGAMVSVALEV